MSLTLLNQTELAERWRISERTLERWRWRGEGPTFIKIGGSVAYDMEDVVAYEAARRRVALSQDQRKLSGPERFARGLPR